MNGTIDLGTCTIEVQGNYCKTVFPDGLFCTGTTGLGRPEQEQSAKNMGYEVSETGLNRMLMEHEVGHNLVMQHLGFRFSLVHRLISVFGQSVPPALLGLCEDEEAIVGALQTYIHKGELHEQLTRVNDLQGLVGKFREATSKLYQHG